MTTDNLQSGAEPRLKSRRTRPLIILLAGAMATAGLIRWALTPAVGNEDAESFLTRYQGGTLIIAGGGPLPAEIKDRFLDLAGGRSARLVVIPAYHADADRMTALKKSWHDQGVRHVEVLQAASAQQTLQDSFSQALRDATGVWLTGGDQSWLAERYVGTNLEVELNSLLKRGGVIGGTSAGAAIMTKVMIEQGVETATVSTGLDLLAGAVVDQHFMKRSRLNRLMGVMKQVPDRIAFGIDESTALVVQVEYGRLGVLGNSYVMAYVPQTSDGTERFEYLKRGDIIDIADLRSGEVRVSSPYDLEGLLE